jgi:hypothetical protein
VEISEISHRLAAGRSFRRNDVFPHHPRRGPLSLASDRLRLPNWVQQLAADRQHVFPGQVQMKPEQLEIAQLEREVARLKTGHPRKSRDLLDEGVDVKFAFIAEHWGIWPAEWLCEALGVSRGGFHWLTRSRGQSSRSDEELDAKVRASSSPAIEPTAPGGCGTTSRRGRRVVWTASDRAFDAAAGSQSPSATASTAARSG